MALSNTTVGWLPNDWITQNFALVWLDQSIDKEKYANYHSSIMNLRQVVNRINIFTDVDECVDFITDIGTATVFMIVSEELSQTILPVIQLIPQVGSIFILSSGKAQNEKWVKQYSKVNGDYGDIVSLCEPLKQVVRGHNHNSVSISFVKSTNETSKRNLDTLDPSFMYTQILKEILLTINFEQNHSNEFLAYCREQCGDNAVQLANIDKIEKEYRADRSIWWYTSSPFFYSMINTALRLMEVDCIIKMGFFLRDLHQHIAALHAEQFSNKNDSEIITVYRGQGLSETDFNQLKDTQGGLMSFNNFLSTSLDRELSLVFAESNQNKQDFIGVLFQITIDTSTSSTPFAKVEDLSYFQEEKEILFSMHSVFRIKQIQQIDDNNRFWQVNLVLTSDNDPELHALTESVREETFSNYKGWHRLGKLMLRLGHYNKVEELYEILLKQTNDENEKAELFLHLGYTKNDKGEYVEAIQYYEKACEIYQKTLPANYTYLASSYNNIGLAYCSMGEYSKALSYYEKALEIRQKTLSTSHPDLATSYNNISFVYSTMGEYLKAQSYYEKLLEILQKTLPANHPYLATSYNNVGNACHNVGEYSKALSYYEKALDIYQKTLPANHPSLSTSYNNMSLVYSAIGKYSKAFSYQEKALEIDRKTLPANHPALATSYNNMGLVYSSIEEYSKALSYHEKALEIRQKTLPASHPDLATSYNNIGNTYSNMKEHSKALSYYEKALEILQKTFPTNHPSLASSYSNIGSVYHYTGEYSKAFSHQEKALEIYQKTLPANHPDLATSYSNIGLMYSDMGEYLKALPYLEKALEIYQKALPANHPDLASCYNNIGLVYFSIKEYSKAALYFQHALNIFELILPHNHPDIEVVKENIVFAKTIAKI